MAIGASGARDNDRGNGLLAGLAGSIPVWMSHGDRVDELPPGMTALGRTSNTDCAVISDGKRYYGLQFHP